jgi:acyl-CoA thioesterase FadM
VSGFARNLLALLKALIASGSYNPWTLVTSHFWVTPLDCGTRILKSDKYLQLAEAAQLDYLVKTGLLGKLLRRGLRFVNASQLIKFTRPIAMFARVRVQTQVVFADEKCTYFSHCLFVGARQHGEVLVKVKFKSGSITVRPSELIGQGTSPKPPRIQAWDQTLEAM